MARSTQAKKRVAKNKIADLRKKAGLTRRALGARMATSPEQIERWEKGEEIAPGIAGLVALALKQPPEVVFPGLADGQPANDEGWRRLGFDLEAPLFTWEIAIELRGDLTFQYLVDRLDAERVSNILDGECDYDFIAFSSIGRSIYVSVKDIQCVRVLHEVTTIFPGVKYGAGDLRPSHSDVHLYFRGRSAPLRVDAFQMDEEELEHAFAGLDCALDYANECIAIDDEDGDVICIRAAELVLAEVPRLELITEMEELDDEFWSEASP